MSGECQKCHEYYSNYKCGNQILGCDAPGTKIKVQRFNRFYYQDKFFNSQEEFWAYVKEFGLRQTTEEDFDSLFAMIKKDVWVNISLREIRLSNFELRGILEETFLFILDKLFKKMN